MRTLLVALAFLMASTAFAIDQPPTEPAQQRQWLADHVVADMQALGTFKDKDFRKVPRLIEELNDEEVALVTQFYYLTRAKAEQDAGVYAQQQQGVPLDQARAPVADLLTYMQTEAQTCYAQCDFAPYLAQVVYASVPGWCVGQQIYVPESYYDSGYYVGGCYDYGYAGRWAEPVCSAYYNSSSSFYLNYTKNKYVYRDHSIHVAHHSADWYRHHDWHGDLRHDRYGHGNHVTPYHGNHGNVAHNPNKPWKHNGNGNHGNVARNPNKPWKHNGNIARNPEGGQHNAQHSTNPRPQQHASPRPQVAQHNAQRPQQHAQHSTNPRPQQHASPRPQVAQRQHAAPRPQQHAQRPQQHASPRPSHAARSAPQVAHSGGGRGHGRK